MSEAERAARRIVSEWMGELQGEFGRFKSELAAARERIAELEAAIEGARITANVAGSQLREDVAALEHVIAEKQQDWDRERQDFAKIADMLWRAEARLKAERELADALAKALGEARKELYNIHRYVDQCDFTASKEGAMNCIIGLAAVGIDIAVDRYRVARAVKDSLATEETPNG